MLHLHLFELLHELALRRGAGGDGLLGLQLHHRGVLGEVAGGEGVGVVLHLRSDGAKQVRPWRFVMIFVCVVCIAGTKGGESK